LAIGRTIRGNGAEPRRRLARDAKRIAARSFVATRTRSCASGRTRIEVRACAEVAARGAIGLSRRVIESAACVVKRRARISESAKVVPGSQVGIRRCVAVDALSESLIVKRLVVEEAPPIPIPQAKGALVIHTLRESILLLGAKRPVGLARKVILTIQSSVVLASTILLGLLI
jgi:hypothetical protein